MRSGIYAGSSLPGYLSKENNRLAPIAI